MTRAFPVAIFHFMSPEEADLRDDCGVLCAGPAETVDTRDDRPEPEAEPTETRAEPTETRAEPTETQAKPIEAGPPELDLDSDAEDREAAPARAGPGSRLSEGELERQLAAVLFASPEALGLARLVALLERPRPAQVRAALGALRERLEASGLPFELRSIAGGWQLFTSADLAEVVERSGRQRREERVSPAAMETLAVVAYRQPVTKAEVEAIRGVQAGPILRSLVDRGLIRVTGRADVPGHPLLYGTTRRFLDSFGLMSLDELPRDGELLRD